MKLMELIPYTASHLVAPGKSSATENLCRAGEYGIVIVCEALDNQTSGKFSWPSVRWERHTLTLFWGSPRNNGPNPSTSFVRRPVEGRAKGGLSLGGKFA